jgi:heme/copper-type cytochrome/quinol oxidase subunit 4
MANKRSRYQELERTVTAVLIADAIFFLIYLVAAGNGNTFLTVVSAILAIGIALLVLVFLYLNQEYKRRRSFWMLVCACAILACMIASLLLGFPCPAPTPETIKAATAI